MELQSWVTLAVICVAITHVCTAAENSSLRGDHEIMGLPGQPKVSFQQYAGHITVSKESQRALFYYFVEAETNATSKPLVLWLSGGPGCSSVGGGAFLEHGPFKPSGRGTLVKNNYSWNKVANMLYLESPAGVGFSYSKDASFYESANDTLTAQDGLIFLQNWLDNYPEYKTRDFYVTGESYAGHYVPQLAKLIVQAGSKFNLKGIAIGNPLLEFETDENSRGIFGWSHGIISDETYELISATCNISQLVREDITRTNFSGPCQHVLNLIVNQTEGIDMYDVTADVCATSGGSQAEIVRNKLMKPRFQLFHSLQSVHESLTTQSVSLAAQSESTQTVDPCLSYKVLDYLNRKDVQEALHAQLVGVANWSLCSQVLDYDLKNMFTPTIDIVGSLVGSGFRVLVYSGDQDVVVPFIGSRTLVKGLAKELKLNITVPYGPWFEEEQVGGWTEVYGDILTYATIRGGSHLAPYSSPERSLAVFKAFIAGKPLPDGSV